MVRVSGGVRVRVGPRVRDGVILVHGSGLGHNTIILGLELGLEGLVLRIGVRVKVRVSLVHGGGLSHYPPCGRPG